MKGCTRSLATLSLILLILSAVVALFLVNMRLFLFSPEVYASALSDEGVYDRLPAIVADQLGYSLTYNPCEEDPSVCEGEGPVEAGTGGPPAYFANLPEGAWESILSELIDPGWLQDQTESVLDQLFGILTGETSSDAIILSFTEVRDRIKGDAGVTAVLSVIEAQPPCTTEQLNELGQIVLEAGTSDIVLNCNPPDDVIREIEPYIHSSLEEVAGSLPTRIEIRIPETLRDAGSGAATLLSIAQAAVRYAPWVALFWLLAVSVFGVRDLRSWLGWWGTGFLMIGLSELLTALVVPPMLGWNIDRFLLDRGTSGFSPETIELVYGIFQRIVNGFLVRVMAQSGVILAIGLVMLIARMFTRPPSRGEVGRRLVEPRPQL